MLLRKQNSGTVYATRSSGGKSLRANPSNLLVVPTQCLLFRGRQPMNAMGASRRRGDYPAPTRKTPTVQSSAYEGWASVLFIRPTLLMVGQRSTWSRAAKQEGSDDPPSRHSEIKGKSLRLSR